MGFPKPEGHTVRETVRVDMTDDSDTPRCPQALQASPTLFRGTASFALGALGITPSAANLEVGFRDRIYLFIFECSHLLPPS